MRKSIEKPLNRCFALRLRTQTTKNQDLFRPSLASNRFQKNPNMNTPTDTDLPPLIDTPPGLYRHYKGGEYEVVGTVRHSETLEPMTLYRALYGQRGLWVRPAAMFNEEVVIEGVRQPRFRKI
jgi:hypothetical protein